MQPLLRITELQIHPFLDNYSFSSVPKHLTINVLHHYISSWIISLSPVFLNHQMIVNFDNVERESMTSTVMNKIAWRNKEKLARAGKKISEKWIAQVYCRWIRSLKMIPCSALTILLILLSVDEVDFKGNSNASSCFCVGMWSLTFSTKKSE